MVETDMIVGDSLGFGTVAVYINVTHFNRYRIYTALVLFSWRTSVVFCLPKSHPTSGKHIRYFALYL